MNVCNGCSQDAKMCFQNVASGKRQSFSGISTDKITNLVCFHIIFLLGWLGKNHPRMMFQHNVSALFYDTSTLWFAHFWTVDSIMLKILISPRIIRTDTYSNFNALLPHWISSFCIYISKELKLAISIMINVTCRQKQSFNKLKRQRQTHSPLF